ncbi:IS1595 family transposase [Flavobacterium microcysteis]|uniref:IS1595 family transposase n=1 Tax=Flavobacterium microcysteis TaxID=2596891 RepID=A0A501QFY1_9FLAO|nr:IS1595 family transposase [Flavobacterium microcysteis]TPD71125.1 IS1595 family transposase [Flavobacterium microcysteis]
MFNTNFKSMLELIQAFPTEESCIKYLEQILWDGEPVSPFDPESKIYRCKEGRYKCKNTGKYFTVRTGTMYDGTKIGLQKWFLAIWLVTCHKKGISSLQLGRDLNISQKGAWFLLQRIRVCLSVENDSELEGVVEIDETFVGGKNKNRHKDKKVPMSQGRSYKDKVPVLGMLERGGNLTCVVVCDTKRETIQPLVRKFVKPDSKVVTDEWHAYNGLNDIFEHHIVNHGKKEYVNLQDNSIHSNSIEGFWGIFKRGMIGIYNHTSKKHLPLYVNEFVFRYNMRKHPESDKFNWMVANSGIRTKYMDIKCQEKS